MIETVEMKVKIQELLLDDPLFDVIKETPLEDVFYKDSYLFDVIEKKYYSTPEVAGWFGITDAQLRYYIKPFASYIFDESSENPSTPTVIRLNFLAILRLRMILLLKEEYRVVGLKRLLGLDEQGQLIRQKKPVSTEVGIPDDLSSKVDVLSNVLQQVLQTGLFEMQQDEESNAVQITLNQDFLSQNMKLLSVESTQQIAEIQKSTAQLKEENATLQKQVEEIQKSRVNDVISKVREKQIEQRVIASLRAEALQHFTKDRKTGLFAKLFRSSQIIMAQEQFVQLYVEEHLPEKLEVELKRYYE